MHVGERMISAVPSSPAEFQGVFLLGVQHVAAYTLLVAKAMVLSVCLFVFAKRAMLRVRHCLLKQSCMPCGHGYLFPDYAHWHIGIFYRLADC